MVFIEKLLKENLNFKILIIFTILIFFPFFLKLNFFFGSKIFLKDLLIFIFAIYVAIKNNFFYYEDIFYRKIIATLLFIILIIHFYSLVTFLISNQNHNNLKFFFTTYIRSFFLMIGSLIYFFFIFLKCKKKYLFRAFKIYLFFCFVIFLEFIFSIFLKIFLYDNEFVKTAYPNNIFRSLFVNGHIATSIHLGVGFFLSLFFFLNEKMIRYLYLSIILLIPIFYNAETRLTILSFVFVTFVYLFSKKNKNYSFLFIIKNLLIFTAIIFLIIFFSDINEYDNFVKIYKLKIMTTSLFDRFNLFIIYLWTFVNFPFGVGFENAGSFIKFIDKKIIFFIGNFENLSAYIVYITNFDDIHNFFSKPHSFISNFITTFGIFIIPITIIFLKFYKSQLTFNLKKKTNINSAFHMAIILLFFATASLINYTFEIEYIFLLVISSYMNFLKKNVH